MPVGSSAAAMSSIGVVALSNRGSRLARIASAKAASPEPSVTTTRAAEFMWLHWSAMNTAMPAKTKVPPRKPSTRTRTTCARVSPAGGAGPIADVMSTADSPCCRAVATMSSRARARALTSLTSARLVVYEPADGVDARNVVILIRRRQRDGNDPSVLDQRGARVVPVHAEQVADNPGAAL